VSADPADRVGAIVEAAEQAADDLLERTEERVRARIAEAARAADNRVKAAEAEAEELREEARRLLADAQRDAESVRLEALADIERLREQAMADAAERVRVAEARAVELRDSARAEAREIVADASDAARDVLRDGTRLSGHLRELSDSLRTNAELLLRDVRGAHAQMAAQIEQAERIAPGAAAAATERTSAERDLDVPEFLPPRR
jgi:hypothetical protein